MAEYILDERDVKFVLYEMLNVEQLCQYEPYKDYTKEDFDMIMEQGWKLAKEVIAPCNEQGDHQGVRIEDGVVKAPDSHHEAYKAYCEGGWGGLSSDPEYGGQGCPESVGMAIAEASSGACVAFAMTPGLTRGAANLIHAFSPEEDKAIYLEKMYSGQWAGSMCLTEPAAGSAVGDLTSKATLIEGHKYKIQGTKIFISSGDHDLTENIIHLFLAKIDAPDTPKGIKGVSLFIVPKFKVNEDGSVGESNDVVCPKVEEKMGIHGSPTAVLNFGDNDNCEGYLVGEPHHGIKYMFQMMNEARMGVGLQALSVSAAAYQLALKYSKDRVQGTDIREMKNADAPRVEIVKHPDVRRMLMYQKAMTEGFRALIYSTTFFDDMAKVVTDEAEKTKYHQFVEILTPICKSYSSDYGYVSAAYAAQVMGGYGFCQEYGVEQHIRDLKIFSIYEGTNTIQALDLVGRKLGMGGGMVLMNYLNALNTWVDENKEHPVLGDLVNKLDAAKGKLIEVTMSFQMDGAKDMLYPVANASNYLDMFGHVQIAYLLMQQAVIAEKALAGICEEKGAADDDAKKALIKDHDDAKFYNNKIATAKYFVNQILPHALADAEVIGNKDQSIFDVEFE